MRGRIGRALPLLSLLGALGATLGLLILVGDVVRDGLGHLSGHFFTNFASRFPERAGIWAPLQGTIWLGALTAFLAFPISVGAAVYLEEYAPQGRWTHLIRANIGNLAGVPSVVYGILGLAIFVRALSLGRSVLAGALTLSLLTIPLMILAVQQALRGVPRGHREAAYALGASRWQVVRYQVLPRALPGIVSGAVLALGRAIGETAPLILIGAVTFIAFTPESVTDPFTALPVQIFHWVTRPQEDFRGLAAAAIIVLLLLLLLMNGLAMMVRLRLERRFSRGP
jgi:phosphate transport system permease protein